MSLTSKKFNEIQEAASMAVVCEGLAEVCEELYKLYGRREFNSNAKTFSAFGKIFLRSALRPTPVRKKGKKK